MFNGGRRRGPERYWFGMSLACLEEEEEGWFCRGFSETPPGSSSRQAKPARSRAHEGEGAKTRVGPKTWTGSDRDQSRLISKECELPRRSR